MTLTVKEKEHWKTSIDRKVQRSIDAIYAEGESSFRDRIQKESRRKALQSLGIEELQNRNVEISDQLRVLQEEQRELEKKMADTVKARCSEYKVQY
jgi:predicted transcriptional regulator